MNSSKNYYNKLAESYAEITNSRLSYLNAVDDIVTEKGLGAETYLDVGAGDGRRSMKISAILKPKKVTLIDNAVRIAEKIAKLPDVHLFIGTIEEFNHKEKFDLITCLWNVLGHIGTESDRLSFFNSVKKLLSKNGKCILDVNNRYNIEYYGSENVMENLKKDVFGEEDSGYFKLDHESIITSVYTHAPYEIEKMIKAVGLKVTEVLYIDYETGQIRKSCFEGQMVYVIEHK